MGKTSKAISKKTTVSNSPTKPVSKKLSPKSSKGKSNITAQPKKAPSTRFTKEVTLFRD